ncbi:MAG: NADP(H)-dependent aldo-keto reductase [Saprospiraceae bacterium]|nr:NADP(H)-dependent aldo-keto reductase [Saprospiraceae bacterium]
MKFDTLGDTDIQVSRICLGTMTFGEQNTEVEAHDQLDYALTQGINFIDTAELYAVPPSRDTQGLTEQFIGTWLARRGKRDDLIMASKIVGPSNGIDWVRSDLNFSKESIRTALEDSLKRLQTDYIDLYQLHWPERKTNFFGKLGYSQDEDDPWMDNFVSILEEIQTLIREGKIRYFGLSNETPWGVMRFLHLAEKFNLPRLVSVQNPYSLLNRSYEVGLAEVSVRERVGLLAYSPLAFGLLSGKYHRKEDKPGDRINQFKQMSRYNSESSWYATERYIEIAASHAITPAQLSLAFVNSRPFVTSNIIGATTLEQLKENIGSIDIDLSDDAIQEIDKVQNEISNPAP